MARENAPAAAARPEVVSFVLGPVATNAYLVGDPRAREAVVIDPGWDGHRIARAARQRDWRVTGIWLTHGHFDHFGGTAGVAQAFDVPVALHPDDLPMWRFQGGAPLFGVSDFDAGPEPSVSLAHKMRLQIGEHAVEVRHTPGHSPGHVIFVLADAGMVFCGDLIFQSGVGRADLPGGDWATLLESIRAEILTLPDETALHSGHGPNTTVGQERRTNPFLVA